MNNKFSLTITHLYPKYMNIYSDIGNIIVLKKRCEWRNIEVNYKEVNLRERLPKGTDIYFMGGGQDDDQIKVFKDLQKKKNKLIKQIEKGVTFLGICGGFQLLGKSFITGDKKVIKGIGVLDIETKSVSNNVKSRCIGNIIAKLNNKVIDIYKMPLNTIVGFENHSGQTFLGSEVEPLGFVIKGNGNNIKDKNEGCIYKNVIGTYLHGSFLPKNPHIADWIIEKAIKRKYRKSIKLCKIDDEDAYKAHKFILDNY